MQLEIHRPHLGVQEPGDPKTQCPDLPHLSHLTGHMCGPHCHRFCFRDYLLNSMETSVAYSGLEATGFIQPPVSFTEKEMQFQQMKRFNY